MSRRSTWTNVRMLVATVVASVCSIATATCGPVASTFEIFRDDNRARLGVFGFIVDDPFFFDDCFHHDDLFFFD